MVGGDRNLSITLWQCWSDQLVQHTTRIGCPGRDPSSKMTYLKQDDEKLVLMLDRNLSRA